MSELGSDTPIGARRIDDGRKFGPKPVGHPTIGVECPGCDQPFRPGDYTTLVPLGPGDDPEQRRRCRERLAYNGRGIEVHWACATGQEDAPRILVVGPDGMPG